MKKILSICLLVGLLIIPSGCKSEDKKVKIGVSFGVGEATRWPQELVYMEEKAKEMDIDIQTVLNKTDEPKTQLEDCKELVDSGIDVLIYTPRNIHETKEVIEYAHESDVKVISYARLSWDVPVDMFIGYDTYLIGKDLGKYATEKVYSGDYIILKGDENDFNTMMLYDGMMQYVNELEGDINIIADEYVEGWNPDKAKEIVKTALTNNNLNVDVILAPNDALAGAAIAALDELGVSKDVLVTGMDAELSAVQRVACGKQEISSYMDLKALAEAAVVKAKALANEDDTEANAEINNGRKKDVKSYLINGQMITKENLDRIVIDTKVYTKEEVYIGCE